MDRRGKERKEYEQKEAARRKQLEEEQRLQDEEKAKQEEVATKELRKNLVHKPEPIRNYKPAPEREFIEPTMVSPINNFLFIFLLKLIFFTCQTNLNFSRLLRMLLENKIGSHDNHEDLETKNLSKKSVFTHTHIPLQHSN